LIGPIQRDATPPEIHKESLRFSVKSRKLDNF